MENEKQNNEAQKAVEIPLEAEQSDKELKEANEKALIEHQRLLNLIELRENESLSSGERDELIALLLERDKVQLRLFEETEMTIEKYAGELYTKNSRVSVLEHEMDELESENEGLRDQCRIEKHHSDNLTKMVRTKNNVIRETTRQLRRANRLAYGAVGFALLVVIVTVINIFR